jgi:CheY-like chemotaxis protein
MSKVLIIEDSPVQALALGRLLEQQGLRVLPAHNGQCGVDMARQWLPDVIVLNVSMPDMDGFEVCRRLQGDPATFHIPIIMRIARRSSPTPRHSVSLGTIDFVPKDDFTGAVLVETLRQLHILTGP